MGFKINSNSSTIFTSYQTGRTQKQLSESLEKFATGQRINKASDDAAGMLIANRLKSQADGYGQAVKNANDAISVIQIADGALGQALELVQDIRTRAVQAGSPAQSPESLQAIQAEINHSLGALSDIAQTTSFNGQKLLSGEFSDKQFQVGTTPQETVSISLGSVDPSQMTDENSRRLTNIDITTEQGREQAIEMADTALEYLSRERSRIGATQNQLGSTIGNLENAMVNIRASESQIRDVDLAEESMNFNRLKLLARARAFAQAQANSNASNVIDILR